MEKEASQFHKGIISQIENYAIMKNRKKRFSLSSLCIEVRGEMKLKKKVKKFFNKAERKGLLLGKLYTSLIRTKRKMRYSRYSKLPVEKDLIIFESFMGRKYADSPKAIYEYMIDSEDYKDYKFVWAFRDSVIDNFKEMEQTGRTTLVRWGSDEYYKVYARAGYWVVNTRIPSSIERRREQEYIQCWHGTPFKKLGCDIISEATESEVTRRKVIYDDVKRYSYLISPSAYFTEVMTSALNLNILDRKPAIIEEGYPRNDGMVNGEDSDIARVKSALNIPEDKKVILYAPTYREDSKGSNNEYLFEEGLDLPKLRESLGDGFVVLHRSHYYIKGKDNEDREDGMEGFVIDVSDYPEINDLYIASDILITDYSSVFFDFSILKRPIVFYMPDLNHYKDSLRGLYMELDELPGPVSTTQEEVLERLKTLETWTNDENWKERYEKFSDRFTYNEDGSATEKVIKSIFKKGLMV